MSNKKQSGIYVTVEGSYYSRQPGKITLSMPFNIELQLTDKPDFQLPPTGKVLSVCRNRLLPNYFFKHYKEYPDYTGIRECRIADIKTVGKKSSRKQEVDISDMTMEQLHHFAFENDLTINPGSSSSIVDARRAVKDAFENKKLEAEALANEQAEKEKREKEEFAEVQEITEFAEANAL